MPIQSIRPPRTCEQCGGPLPSSSGPQRRFCDRACYNVSPKRRKRTIEDRLWGRTKTNEHGCRLWTGPVNWDGYGAIEYQGKTRSLTSVAYELTYGPMPAGCEASHQCDRFYPAGDITYRRCLAPEHLIAEPHGDNIRHMFKVSRNKPLAGEANGSHLHPETLLRGEANHKAKLTAEDVIEIRRAYASGMTQGVLAVRFGVRKAHIGCITRREVWTHIA